MVGTQHTCDFPGVGRVSMGGVDGLPLGDRLPRIPKKKTSELNQKLLALSTSYKILQKLKDDGSSITLAELQKKTSRQIETENKNFT